LDAFILAAKLAPTGAKYWLRKLKQCNEDQYNKVFDQMPETVISDLAKRFALKMIEANRNRLLESEF